MKRELFWLLAVLVVIALASSLSSRGGWEEPKDSPKPLPSERTTSTPKPPDETTKPSRRSWDRELNVEGVRPRELLADVQAELGPPSEPGQKLSYNSGFRNWDRLGVSALFLDGKAGMIQGTRLSQGKEVVLKIGDSREKIFSLLGQPDTITPVSEMKMSPDVFNSQGREKDEIWVFSSEPTVLWLRVDEKGQLLGLILQ